MISTKNLVLVALFFILPNFSNAKPSVAKVIKIKGKATQLRPGALKASRLRLGDGIIEDTSVLTQERSFVRIEFLDGSKLNLGPKSKIVVKAVEKDEPSMIDLLKGKVRTQVKKSIKTKKHKFFIKTKTAAMGVRGTDFHSTFNPENNITNVITYEGEVAVTKLDERKLYEPVVTKNLGVEQQVDGDVKITKLEKDGPTISNKLDTVLGSSESVVVKKGQFSGVSAKLSKATAPVKINPVQFTALYKNEELDEKTVMKAKRDYRKKVMVQKRKELRKEAAEIKMAAQVAPKEASYNSQTKELVPKAGGFLDLDSGLYVAPNLDEKMDNDHDVYKSKGVGSFDAETGQYVPPAGIFVNATSGFVVNEKVVDEKRKKVLLVKAQSLNDYNRTDVMITTEKEYLNLQDEVLQEDDFLKLSNRELFKASHLSFAFLPTDRKLEAFDDSSSGEQKIKFENNPQFSLEWRQSSTGLWQTYFLLDLAKVKVDQQKTNAFNGNFSEEGQSMYNLTLGSRFFLRSRINLISSLSLQQDFFIDGSSGQAKLNKLTLANFNFGVEWLMIRSQNSHTWLEFTPALNLPKNEDGYKVSAGIGINLALNYWYFINKSWRLELGLWTKRRTYEVKKDDYSTDMDLNMGGVKVGFGTIF